jgi:hypothetical protein
MVVLPHIPTLHKSHHFIQEHALLVQQDLYCCMMADIKGMLAPDE